MPPELPSALPPPRLAALPVELHLPALQAVPDFRSSPTAFIHFVRQWCPVLIPAWIAFLIILTGAAILLRALMLLDDRRAAFVSAVTHELRTPLTTLRLYVEMQRAGMVKDPQRLESYMAVLDQESGRLVHLVENVLAYARLEQRRAADRMQPVTVGELIGQSRRELDPHVVRQGLTLAATTGPGLDALTVITDPAVVSQILFNLIDNACKYGRSDHQPAIRLDAAITDGRLSLTVRDYGPGVADSFHRRLFQPFTRAQPAAASDQPGVGLGLSLCRRLARSLGGDLRHQAPPDGPGAAFILTLPIAAGRAASAARTG